MEGFLEGEALHMNLEEREWWFGSQKAKMGVLRYYKARWLVLSLRELY